MLKEPIIKKDKPTTSDEGGRPKWFAIGYDDHKLYYVGTWDCPDEAYASKKRLYPDVLCMYVVNDELVKSWMFQIGVVLEWNNLYYIPNEEVSEESLVCQKDHSTINQPKMMKFFALAADGNLYYIGIHDDSCDAYCVADEMYEYDKKTRDYLGIYEDEELLQWRPLVNTILGGKGFYKY